MTNEEKIYQEYLELVLRKSVESLGLDFETATGQEVIAAIREQANG
jgi:hypothetical protein